MKIGGAQIGPWFWRWWVITNAVGFGVGWLLGVSVLLSRGESNETGWVPVLVMFLGWGLIGASIGISQWTVLRQTLGSWWVLATIIGWVVGAFVVPAIITAGGGIVISMPIVLMGNAALAGLLQWFTLRRYSQRAALWVLASLLGWGIGFGAVVLLAGRLNAIAQSSDLVVAFVGEAVVGAISGAITGLALIWLLQPPGTKQRDAMLS